LKRSDTPRAVAGLARLRGGLRVANGPADVVSSERLFTFYQPIVRLADRSLLGVEALVRFDHPTSGIWLPDHFVPQLEDAGLGHALASNVARLAFEDYARHLAPLGIWLAVNLPLDVLLDPVAMESIDVSRRASGVPADRVVIELTETLPVDPGDTDTLYAVAAAVARLRGAGYAVAIDDVCPAMDDPLALLELGFNVLKLDKGVVLDAAMCDKALAFIAGIVAAGHAADVKVTAEGIEDAAGWSRMRGVGVDHGQGFMIGRAMAAATVGDWLGKWTRKPQSALRQSALRPVAHTSR
jgi:EAL domain-containing protein (putative c-di-GMP-specific phosphodiesterase class I)